MDRKKRGLKFIALVNLSWNTIDAETIDDLFEIERSFDQVSFSKLVTMAGAQSDNGVSSKYLFKDGSADLKNHNLVYYRIRQVNLDGKYEYSDVKMVRINPIPPFVQVLPNPYMDKLNINFVRDASGNAEVRLISTSGNLVKTALTSEIPYS